MTSAQLFPSGVALLETGAALVYAWHGNIKMAVFWAGYAVAAWALVGMR